MRTFLALSLAAGASAQLPGSIGGRGLASPVHVAPHAAPVRTSPYGRGYGVVSPYSARAAVARSPYLSPYSLAPRATPYVVAAPKPVVAAPKPEVEIVEVEVIKPVEVEVLVETDAMANRMEDYAYWRNSYLKKQEEGADALAHSPIFWMRDSDGAMWNRWGGREAGVKTQMLYDLAHEQLGVTQTSNELNLAAMMGADHETLAALKSDYDYERLEYQNALMDYQKLLLRDRVPSNMREQQDILEYQIARLDYISDAADAAEQAAEAKTAADAQYAAVNAAVAQLDLIEAMNTVLPNNDFGDFGELSNALNYQQASYDVQSAQQSFDLAVEKFEANPEKASLLYAMQMAELDLQAEEANYMETVAEMSFMKDSLGSLMNGNYALALNFKGKAIDAKQADLKEKLEHALFVEAYGEEPYGRSKNMPSTATQNQKWYTMG